MDYPPVTKALLISSKGIVLHHLGRCPIAAKIRAGIGFSKCPLISTSKMNIPSRYFDLFLCFKKTMDPAVFGVSLFLRWQVICSFYLPKHLLLVLTLEDALRGRITPKLQNVPSPN